MYISPLSLPFLKERASDENRYVPHVIETLSLLGTLIKFQSESLRQQVAQTMADFYCAETNEAQTEGVYIQKIKLFMIKN